MQTYNHIKEQTKKKQKMTITKNRKFTNKRVNGYRFRVYIKIFIVQKMNQKGIPYILVLYIILHDNN